MKYIEPELCISDRAYIYLLYFIFYFYIFTRFTKNSIPMASLGRELVPALKGLTYILQKPTHRRLELLWKVKVTVLIMFVPNFLLISNI